jgi:hypothetical protein
MKIAEREQRNKDIILLYETGDYTLEQLAIKYNLHKDTIWEIVKAHKPFNYRDAGRKVSLNIDKIPEALRKGQVWSTKNWGSGPPGGIDDRMIHYQDKTYNGSFYDEDDFWKFTI